MIPPGAFIEDTFTLTPRSKGAGKDLSVNYFMRSLAEERKGSAIGVVLSGIGADGTLGLESIQAEGGVTFAQDHATACYDGMPRSAIDSGCADFVCRRKRLRRSYTESGLSYVRKEEDRGAEEQGKELEDSVAVPTGAVNYF